MHFDCSHFQRDLDSSTNVTRAKREKRLKISLRWRWNLIEPNRVTSGFENTLHLRGISFSAAADFWLTSCSSRYVVHHSLWWSVCQPARPESQTYTWWPGATRYLCGLCWRWSQTGRPQTSVTYPKWRKSGCTLKKKCKEYFNSNCSCNINCFNNFERLLQTNKLTKLLLT